MLKISIIIPSYNQGKYLEDTILSVLDQDYPLLELFVIDGGSMDNSTDIIKKYEHRLTGWISEKDNGQSEAINKGLSMCTGDIVSWLCSDDLYKPGSLKKVNEVFSSLPLSVGVVHGNSEIFNSKKVLFYDKGYGGWTVERQLAGMMFPQPSSFIRKTWFEKAGPLNTTMHYGMDYELYSKLILICDFHYEDFFFSKYRLHGDSKSTTAISKFIDEWIIIFNSITEGLKIKSIEKSLVEMGLKVQPDLNLAGFYNNLRIVKKIDYDKMLFYFLVNVIRYDYATEKFERVSNIGTFIKNNLSKYLKFEPSVKKILTRVKILPPSLLRIARNFKRTLSKE